MTAETVTPPAEHAGSDIGRLLRSADRYRVALGGIVVAQAVWLGVLTSRGWYYQADFSNLAQATGRPLSWSYLTLSQGGHLGIAGRFVFWVLNRTIPLNYPATIVLRLLAQAAATLMLGRLLALLVGRRAGVLVVLALYAISPFLVEGTLWLTSSIGLLGSQLLLLAGLTSHVRYAVSREWKWAVAAAAGVIGATLVSEQAAVTALILPLLSVGFLFDGTLRERLRSTLSCWREWALIALPVLGFAAYFFLGPGNYASTAHRVSLGDALALVRTDWSASIAPSLTGAQFRWINTPNSYYGFAFPGATARVASLVLVGVAVAIGARRIGWRAVLAWSMPAIVSAIGIIVVAIGRFDAFGMIIAHRMEYAFYTAVPAAVAVCLCLWFTGADAIRARLEPASAVARETEGGPHTREHRRVEHRIAAGVASIGVALVIAAASVASGVSYTQQWAQNPARSYVRHLTASARQSAAPVNLFDTGINPVIVPVLEPARYISDLLALTGVHARFDQGVPAPKVVAADGRIVPGRLLSAAHVNVSGTNRFCNELISKITDRTEPLTSQPHRNEWFLRLSYFQQLSSVVYVYLVDGGGHDVAPVGGSRIVLAPSLGVAYLRFPSVSPTAVRIQSRSTSTNICITAAEVGYPFPATP